MLWSAKSGSEPFGHATGALFSVLGKNSDGESDTVSAGDALNESIWK